MTISLIIRKCKLNTLDNTMYPIDFQQWTLLIIPSAGKIREQCFMYFSGSQLFAWSVYCLEEKTLVHYHRSNTEENEKIRHAKTNKNKPKSYLCYPEITTTTCLCVRACVSVFKGRADRFAFQRCSINRQVCWNIKTVEKTEKVLNLYVYQEELSEVEYSQEIRILRLLYSAYWLLWKE